MSFFDKILNIIMLFQNDEHILNVHIGEKKYLVQDVLNNYEDLIGKTKSEAVKFFRDYNLLKKHTNEWIYEVQNNQKGLFIIILRFYQDELIKVSYSYFEY
ncbi:hypothetical protein QX233_13205 [Chryseobacterium gambrini]|uniref:Motility quorum-sensing regulator, toxin of MqsA n=2 Tax=Chryseobacterium gambrini TaxID=373672 RepID=A0AAJ1VKC1_9FLAO|nr:hypothetical protein [Chryseobacterium sp. ZHDP1]MDN4013428.1 hypothetical protein [Chryseobacterium gambrini]QWA37810.1 hypothetical protein KKI44_18110 [Chryseobacterium sp. ZHDP1]